MQIQGSSAFVVQRKLEPLLYEAKHFCLDYKNKNMLDWQTIQNHSKSLQNNIQDYPQGSQAMRANSLIKDQLLIKWEYWRQRSKSKWDAQGDSSTSFSSKASKAEALRTKSV